MSKIIAFVFCLGHQFVLHSLFHRPSVEHQRTSSDHVFFRIVCLQDSLYYTNLNRWPQDMRTYYDYVLWPPFCFRFNVLIVKIKIQAYTVRYNANQNASYDSAFIGLVLLLWLLSFSSFMMFWLSLNLHQAVGPSRIVRKIKQERSH